MTVANVILETHRVRLVTDTVGYRQKEPACFARKVRQIEGLGLAMIVRGLRSLGDVMEETIVDCTDFEAAIAEMHRVLETAPSDYLPGGGAEVTALGYFGGSARAVRLLATIVDSSVSVRRVDLEPGVYLAPTLGTHALPTDMTEAQMLKVALLQQGIAVRHGLNICIGGDVELTTVDETGIATVKLGEYPDKALMAARIAKHEADDEAAIAA